MEKSTSCRLGTVLLFGLAACGDSQTARPSTPTPLDPTPGRYALTVTVGSACTALPNIVHVRTYTSTIESRDAGYVVTLSDAKFLADLQLGFGAIQVHCGDSSGLGCNQFTASREGNQLQFRLVPNYQRFNYEFGGSGGSIVELIPPGDHQLSIEGTGPGRLDGTTIHASIDGRVWYCPTKITNFPDECAGCENAANVAMTFTRH